MLRQSVNIFLDIKTIWTNKDLYILQYIFYVRLMDVTNAIIGNASQSYFAKYSQQILLSYNDVAYLIIRG